MSYSPTPGRQSWKCGLEKPKAMLMRDVGNITQYYARFAPELADTHYSEEIWELNEKGEIRPDLQLTGKFEFPTEA
ncbi:MAG: hypothetical protein IT423_16730, partial [Pirellulaceae bacterium]|nr:hypothetical protein [Pirellulaceae bacterium]